MRRRRSGLAPTRFLRLSRPADIAAERHERRASLLSLLESQRPAIADSEAYGKLRGQAVTLTGAKKGAPDEFSLDGEPQAIKERYGLHRFGRAMLLARRLAQAGVAMTTIHFNEMTICDGWDTHSKNFAALESELLPMLDQRTVGTDRGPRQPRGFWTRR